MFDNDDDHMVNDDAAQDDENIEYGFLPEGARRDDEPYGYETKGAGWWGLGNHAEETPEPEDVQKAFETLSGIPGLDSLLREAEATANSYVDNGFECPVCGLRHGHASDKHDVREFFGVTDEFVDMMNFNPYCHCGVNELARLLNYWRSISVQVFEDQDTDDFDIQERRQAVVSAANSAPIPEKTRRKMDNKLGSI